jgi:hypothetical protein
VVLLTGPFEVGAHATCVFCGGEVEPDVAGNPTCYRCGDPEMIPHQGTHCERCGAKLTTGQFFDPMCWDCDGDGFRDGSE